MSKKRDNPQRTFWDGRAPETGEWRPEPLPDLSQFERVWVDTEYESRPHTLPGEKVVPDLAGIAIGTELGTHYLPVNHKDGGNMDEDEVREWARRELRGKTISNLATGLDAEVLRKWGVDLEAQDCKLHDVAHAAALIDENRWSGVNLNDLGLEEVGRGKRPCPVEPQDIHKVHSSQVGPYAEADVALARDIDLSQQPKLDREGLNRVMQVEDDLIWVNNHIERTGARLDMPKLQSWVKDVALEYQDTALGIWYETGVKLRPNAAASWYQLFNRLNLPHPPGCDADAKNGIKGYTDDFLKHVEHPAVVKGLRMRRLESLRTKYLAKYLKMQRGGVLYFKLYQLRASEEDYGTVVGRYSSADPNIQQVFKVENQIKKFGDGFIIRELMIPGDDSDLFAVDGSQLQFRLFAHYSKDAQLIRRYNEDRSVDFHQMVADLFGLSRQAAKHNNFALVLGMGREKLAIRIGLACTCREPSWWAMAKKTKGDARVSGKERRKYLFGIDDNHDEGCPGLKSNAMANEYDRALPAAKETMKLVKDTAEDRGWVKSLLGRRRRFKDAEGTTINFKFYSAFASLLQMSEADLVKSKLLTLYKERETVGIRRLRMPVHDEMTGDLERSRQARKRLEECCDAVDHEDLRLKVPMLWESKYGRNWKDMEKEAK